jgi:hypothetical protein
MLFSNNYAERKYKRHFHKLLFIDFEAIRQYIEESTDNDCIYKGLKMILNEYGQYFAKVQYVYLSGDTTYELSFVFDQEDMTFKAIFKTKETRRVLRGYIVDKFWQNLGYR